MELHILQPDNVMLREQCQQVRKKELGQKSMQEMIEQMLDFVYGKNIKLRSKRRRLPLTVGLSANQVGIPKAISVVDMGIGKKLYSDIHVLINPEIIWHSKTLIEKCEGCVNLPHIWGYVKRYKRVKVRAMDRSGNTIELDLTGWPAVLLQHEIDHLLGRLFIDKLSDPKKAFLVEPADYLLFKKLKRSWKKYTDMSNLVRPNY